MAPARKRSTRTSPNRRNAPPPTFNPEQYADLIRAAHAEVADLISDADVCVGGFEDYCALIERTKNHVHNLIALRDALAQQEIGRMRAEGVEYV